MKYQPANPEQAQSQTDLLTQRGMGKIIRAVDAEQSHQQDHQADEESMRIHHLAVDQT
ncbi:hypothetical protein [Niabella terrae]